MSIGEMDGMTFLQGVSTTLANPEVATLGPSVLVLVVLLEILAGYVVSRTDVLVRIPVFSLAFLAAIARHGLPRHLGIPVARLVVDAHLTRILVYPAPFAHLCVGQHLAVAADS